MNFIHKEIKKISENLELSIASIQTYYILLNYKKIKSAEEKLAMLMNFKDDLIQLITYDLFDKFDICLEILRQYFEFFAINEDIFLEEGINLFGSFKDFIKNLKFNSLKTFLFYFAYQSKKFGSPMVKELLSQELLTAEITDPKVYLDFCMYCFFKGLYYIEKKNYFLATYLFCTPVKMGLNNYLENIIVFNEYTVQMIKALCFLKALTDFDITNYLFKEKSRISFFEEKTKYDEIDDCFAFLRKERIDYDNFSNFIKMNKEIYQDYKLIGLKNEAREMVILKKIKDNLKFYKKIKLAKLSQKTNIEFNLLLKIIKKKYISGDLNVKYDEESDVLEVFDIDPGMKGNVKKTQDLYKSIIEGNKNYFINLRDKKLNELNGGGKVNMIKDSFVYNINNEEEDDYD